MALVVSCVCVFILVSVLFVVVSCFKCVWRASLILCFSSRYGKYLYLLYVLPYHWWLRVLLLMFASVEHSMLCFLAVVVHCLCFVVLVERGFSFVC